MTGANSNFPQTRGPLGLVPLPPKPSIRRTTTLDTSWPEGRHGRIHVDARGRDLLTPEVGLPRVLAHDQMLIGLTSERRIATIQARTACLDFESLLGHSAVRGFRKVLNAATPEDTADTLQYMLLDDLVGATFVNTAAWIQHSAAMAERVESELRSSNVQMEGVCHGWAPGSSALEIHDQISKQGDPRQVPPLDQGTDDMVWHSLPPGGIPSTRRARKIDVWLDDSIRINAYFQDAAFGPAGHWQAFHEYTVEAEADPERFELLSISAIPHVLPFRECPGAICNIGRLIGTPLPDMRVEVLRQLAKTDGCTHLNDVLRSLACVPALAKPAMRQTCSSG